MKMKHPADERERLIAALNSTVKDLHPSDNGRVFVTGKNLDGEVVYLGDIDEGLFYQDIEAAKAVIEHIRFAPQGETR